MLRLPLFLLPLTLLLAACPGERDRPIVTPSDPYVAALGEARISTSDWIAHVALTGALSGEGGPSLAERLLEDAALLDRTLEDALVHQRLRERARQILPLIQDEERETAFADDAPLHAALESVPSMWIPPAQRERITEDSARLRLLPPEQPALLLGERLRTLWDRRHSEVDALLITLPNDFTTAEIAAHLNEYQAEIRAWFDNEGAALLGSPTRVRVSIIGLPAMRDGDDAPPPAILEARARALGSTLTPENFAEAAQRYSVDRTREQGGDLGWREPTDVPGLPRGEAGDILGPVRHGPHWIYYYIREIEEAREAEWDDERMAFRAATHLLRRNGQSEAVDDWLETIATLDDPDALMAWAEEHPVRVTEPPPFRHHPDGFIPVLGNAPELSDALFASDAPPSGLLPTLHHQQVRIFALWIRSRTPPSDEAFADDAEAFAETLREELRQARIQRLEDDIRNSVPRVFDTAAARDALRHVLLETPEAP